MDAGRLSQLGPDAASKETTRLQLRSQKIFLGDTRSFWLLKQFWAFKTAAY